MRKAVFVIAACAAVLGLSACTASGVSVNSELAYDGNVDGEYEETGSEYSALTAFEWEYNEDDYPVGFYFSFKDDGTWESYSGGGEDTEMDGTCDFDGTTVVLHYDNGDDDREMVLEEAHKLVDWDGEVLRPVDDWVNFKEDKGPNADINYMWMYENDNTGEYDNYFEFHLDNTWFWTEDDGNTYGAEGTYDFDGKTITLHFDDGTDDVEFTYDEENGKLIDDSGDSLRILGPSQR